MRAENIEHLVVDHPDALENDVDVLGGLRLVERVFEVVQDRQERLEKMLFLVGDRLGDLPGHALLEIGVVGTDPLELAEQVIALGLRLFQLLTDRFDLFGRRPGVLVVGFGLLVFHPWFPKCRLSFSKKPWDLGDTSMFSVLANSRRSSSCRAFKRAGVSTVT